MRKSFIINFLILVFITTILFFVFYFLKNIQVSNITELINEVKIIQKEKVIFRTNNLNNNRVEIIPENLLLNNKNNQLRKVGQDYHGQSASMETIVLELDFKKCQKENFSFLIKYNARGPEKSLNFSKIININKKNYRDIIFFPIYHTTKNNNNKIKFDGFFHSFVMDQSSLLCIDKILKVKNNEQLSLPSFAYYGDKNNYLTISSINKREFGNISFKNSIKSSLNDKRLNILIEKNLKILSHAKRSDDCKKNNCSYPNECYLNSTALLASKEHQQICSVNTDIFKTESYFLEKNKIIIIAGKIINGMFKVNIVDENGFYFGELINTIGKFTFAYKLPKDGNYKIILSNKNNLYHYIENNIEIDKIGILDF